MKTLLTTTLTTLLLATTPIFASCGNLFDTEHDAIADDLQDSYPTWIAYDIKYKAVVGNVSHLDLVVDLPYGHTAFIKALPVENNPTYTAYMVRCDD
jgi:hypothetical protein